MKRHLRDKNFNNKVMVIFFFLIITWYSLVGAIILVIPFFRSHGFEVFVFSYLVLAIIGTIPLFYVWNRFFKDAISSFGTKKFQTCVFHGLGIKRQAYLDQLTRELAEIDFKPINKSSLGSMECFAFGGTDLLFAALKGLGEGIGVRAVSVNGDLKVGFVSSGMKTQRFFTIFLVFIFLGLFASFIPFFVYDPNSKTGTWGYITIGLPLFFIIACIPFFHSLLYRRRYGGRIRRLLVETAESIGGKQITPFKKTTVKLED
jgi:hypothetical protein